MATKSKAKPTARKPAAKSAKQSAAKAHKYVYSWGAGKADGNGGMKPLLGGKGANLAEMSRIGLPVPPGFTATTEVCTYYYANKRTYPASLQAQMEAGMKNMEKIMGTKFGSTTGMPLLVAVRSGARDSMPGMMDTILNLGLNDESVVALATATKNERFAWDCYRRFIQMYGDVVLGVQKKEGEDHEPFETVIESYKHEVYSKNIVDSELTAADQQELVKRFKALVKDRTGHVFPNDPWDQLRGAAGAVFGSWMNDRAIVYRRKYNIPTEWGTAVNVQAMVFGNTGDSSGSGVAFTRNPANGTNEFYGEFLINAQGEDVVAGVRTPEPVLELKKQMPKSYAELLKVRATLEKHFKDVQDIEFTIQEGKLFMLQTRNGKRTAAAALKFSIDMVKEKLIDWKTAVMRNPADQLEQLLAPIFDLAEVKKAKVIATGLPAGPGAATGRIYFNADRAVQAADKGEKVLLVRIETSPEDLRGMIAAEGILTARGGVSSHAALVARQMGKVCVCGAAAIQIDYDKKIATVDGQQYGEGDFLSIDGTAGTVYAGQIPTAPSEIIDGLLFNNKRAQKTEKFKSYVQLMDWCKKATKLSVRTNADTPDQAAQAIAFGAVGIGLTRTEHMFFEGDRIDAMREMILAGNLADREAALAKLLPYQRADFFGIFKALKGYPATIRFLDPPLHEFLPNSKEQQADLAKKLGIDFAKIEHRVHELHEFNPMLGFRGCRLGIKFPEITRMQARAVLEAAADATKKGFKAKPEIMIPLVGFKKELDIQTAIVHEVAAQVQKEKKVKISYSVGTMIEIPRGALTADEIAQTA
ncbi:MAG: pyruvate, phosphate dikinase, partial [Cephaloticoccus sp.]|nr:pyruvate, phosphate dikinase [Cephaloticoccus sp.]